MAGERRMQFCTECRKMTEYELVKRSFSKEIRGQDYDFLITTAVCMNCGNEMSLPGLIDHNVKEIDEQYRSAEGIISENDIERLLKIYRLGKAPASLALGFGEITITRYLGGQVPSKEYSDIIKSALASPAFMRGLLIENRQKIGETAYTKAMTAASSLEKLFSVSDKMLRTIAYIFDKLEEVTPLMLQKLLYFVQGVYSALYNEPIFDEDCRAWVHGPVYAEVYTLFKEFKYDPIDDDRFAIIEFNKDVLTDNERNAIDLVVDTFGMYGGKALERITHKEFPWTQARKGYGEGVNCNELIPKESIKQYFESVHEQYGIDSEEGLNSYIDAMMK